MPVDKITNVVMDACTEPERNPSNIDSAVVGHIAVASVPEQNTAGSSAIINGFELGIESIEAGMRCGPEQIPHVLDKLL